MRAGELELLTGNQIGSLMAYYRVQKLIEQGVITPAERQPLRDRQDLRHHRSAKGDRRKAWPALRRDAHRLQIHRRKTRQVRSRAAGRSPRAITARCPRPRPARCGSQHSQLLRLRRRGELRLQRGGFRPRQGRQRLGGRLRRSRRLREIARAHARSICSTRSTRTTASTWKRTARSRSRARTARRRSSASSTPTPRSRPPTADGSRRDRRRATSPPRRSPTSRATPSRRKRCS